MDIYAIRQTIEQHKERLRQYGLRRVGIFGSTASGAATAQSDIDLLLEFQPGQKTYRNFYGGTTYLETLLNQPVDTLTPQAISPYIKPSVEHNITYVQIS